MKSVRALAARALPGVMATGGLLAMTVGLVAVMPSSEAAAALLKVNNQVSCNDTTGSPNYCTIKVAVTKAKAGDTVQVYAGTYFNKVFVDRVGTSAKPILITNNPGDTVIVKSTSQGFQISAASWVTINGFTIDSTTLESIKCTNCANVTISNNRVTTSSSTGISINASSNMTLSGNQVDHSKFNGIDVIGSNNVTVSGGSVSFSGAQVSGQNFKGIKFDNSTDSLIDGTEVFNNSDSGIYLINNTTRVRVRNVIAHDNARGFDRAAAGIEARSCGVSDGNTVESSIAYSNEDSGINMRWGGCNSLLINNIAYGNGDHGIDVLESPTPTIVNNSVYDNVTAGINIEGNSPNGKVFNNISVDNAIPQVRTAWGEIRVTTSSMPAQADRNIVYASDGLYVYHWNGVYFKKLSSLRTANPGVETNGLQVNPNWVAPGSNDFHLQSSSAAIDSANADAISTSEIDHDAEGSNRCDDPAKTNTGVGSNTYTDRGALEFIASGC